MKKEMILALLLINGVGKKTVIDFLNNIDYTFDNEDIFNKWNVFIQNKTRIDKISFEEFKCKIIEAATILSKSENEGISAISILEEEYPKELKKISNPPVMIYAKGNIALLNNSRNVAIIGTRKITPHGEKVAERLGYLFAHSGYCVVSGLAIGCDMFGHIGCLKANGHTIAILSTPLDNIIPVSNRGLADKILDKNGLLISEYYVGQETTKGFYVERNRLQSAISKAVLVVETDVVGGTMHTARFAIEQGKILACYKCPDKYNYKEQTRGNQKLIEEEKAIPIETIKDIEELKKQIDNPSEKQMIMVEGEQISML